MATKEDIIKRIEEIASTPGFIYTLSFLLCKDLTANTSKVIPNERLNFQEFIFLAGLMVKTQIELVLPNEEQCRSDITEIYQLFEELHLAYIELPNKSEKAQLSKNEAEKMTAIELRDRMYSDLFGSGEMMIEPIFYGEVGAYGFQYLDFAEKKYSYDEHWIKENKGISIRNASKVALLLKELQEVKFRKGVKKTDFESTFEYFLDVFCFSREDIDDVAGDESDFFLNTFSSNPGFVNRKLITPNY